MMIESPKPQAEELFFSRHLVNQLPDAVFCLGSDACFLYLNDAACRQLEYSRQELLSMRLSDIDLNFQRKNWSEQWQSLSQQGSLVVKTQYQTRSGKFLSVELTLVYVKEQDKEFSCAFVSKVEETKPARNVNQTEFKQQTESELQKNQCQSETVEAIEKAKQLSELRSRFLSMLCHQFRSSLNIISFSNSLLKRYVDRWADDKKLPYLDNIQTAVQEIAELLDGLVFFGKSEVEQIEFKPKSVDITGFCRTLVAQMQPLSDGRQQTIEFFSRGNCKDTCIDENILHHILTNLLSNSIKYSPNGSKIEFEVLCEKEQAIIKIKDKGIGISEVDRLRVFDLFFRGSNVDCIPGSGLGLPIVKNLVEIHGGKIELESKVGIGTTFLLTLPVRSLSDEGQLAKPPGSST